MTDTPDPRIEAVAKLLFTGPLCRQKIEDWGANSPDFFYDLMCLSVAEDVLRGIDEAGKQVAQTVTDLDELPSGAVVRDGHEYVYEKRIWGLHSTWLEMGDEQSTYASLIKLPAQILWAPKDDE